jgi:hypothetical protein
MGLILLDGFQLLHLYGFGLVEKNLLSFSLTSKQQTLLFLDLLNEHVLTLPFDSTSPLGKSFRKIHQFLVFMIIYHGWYIS